MKVGNFINSDRLEGSILLYEPTSGAFRIEGPEINQDITQGQVLALNNQKVIQWENKDILKMISGRENMVAQAPFKDIQLPENEDSNGFDQDAKPKLSKKIALIIPVIILLIICGVGFYLSKNISFSNSNTDNTVMTNKSEEENIIKYFNETSKKLKEEKSFDVYKENVEHDNIAKNLAKTYTDVYKELYPKTQKDIIKDMPKRYIEAYDSMVKKNIESGNLKGTIFDGKPLNVIADEQNGTFVLTTESNGIQIKLSIKSTNNSYKVIGIIGAKEFNKTILNEK